MKARRWPLWIAGCATVVAISLTGDDPAVAKETATVNSETEFAPADWTASIPSIYLAGQAVWGLPTTLSDGTIYQPVITRVLRGGTYFAMFADERGKYIAISETDGTVWKVGDYYHNDQSWSLYTYQDATDQTPWIFRAIAWVIIHLIQILFTIAIAVAFLMAVLVIWIFGPGDRARGGRRNQITDSFLQGGGGIGNMWDTSPEYRNQLHVLPGEVDILTRLGEITFNP